MLSYETRRHKGLLEAKAILAGAVFVQEDQSLGFLQKVLAAQFAEHLFGIVRSSIGEPVALNRHSSQPQQVHRPQQNRLGEVDEKFQMYDIM